MRFLAHEHKSSSLCIHTRRALRSSSQQSTFLFLFRVIPRGSEMKNVVQVDTEKSFNKPLRTTQDQIIE